MSSTILWPILIATCLFAFSAVSYAIAGNWPMALFAGVCFVLAFLMSDSR